MVSATVIENTIPVLGASDLETSRRFFADALGFATEWGFESDSVIGSVIRDGCSLMISTFSTAGGTVWIGVEDIVPYYRSAVAAGAQIVKSPTNETYAYDFMCKDPAGNILWFGSEPLPGVDPGTPMVP